MSVLRKFSLIAAMLAAFASLPAAAQKVETDYDHSVNFSQFHTYSWGRVHSSPPISFHSCPYPSNPSSLRPQIIEKNKNILQCRPRFYMSSRS
jgi:hypothetical protein